MTTRTAAVSRHRQISTPAIISLAALSYAVGRCVDWVKRRQQIRRNLELLTSMDDHLLADIGLMRDQVEQAAEGSYVPMQYLGGGSGQ
jgi:uncharacterized protein YjiS (DUF1127 family)